MIANDRFPAPEMPCAHGRETHDMVYGGVMTCSECRYWHDMKCKRYPAWVGRERSDWCGEYEQRYVLDYILEQKVEAVAQEVKRRGRPKKDATF